MNRLVVSLSLLLTVMALTSAQDRPAPQESPGRGGGFDIVKRLMSRDADKDGKLAKSELPAFLQSRFDTLDADGDGVLDSDELKKMSQRIRPAQPAGSPGGAPPPSSIPVFAALDKDGNGEVSAKEIEQAVEALKSLDRNKDGRLNPNEHEPTFVRGGFGPPGFGPQAGTAGKQLEPEEVEFNDGTHEIQDRETFEKLSYQGSEVLIDTHLDGLEFVKFQIEGADTAQPKLYFINTNTHRAHMMFMRAVGIQRGGRNSTMRGVLVYRPLLKGRGGQPGVYTFEFEPWDSFPHDMILLAHDILISKMPLLKDRIGYYPLNNAVQLYKDEKKQYDESGVRVYLEDDLFEDIGYLPLNLGASFGRLRIMQPGERPAPRDIVLYNQLPNEMPRVAGIITAVRQTPLSHVNLRAIQDGVPNAFITAAAQHEKIRSLVGKNVYYRISADRFEIRAATNAEVDSHFADLRPADHQVPHRDLSVKKVRALKDVTFGDSSNVGVKAANLAVLRTLDFPEGTVPNGFAVPFYFYDEFMKYNDLYSLAKKLLNDPTFQQDRELQVAQLKKFRKLIKAGRMPGWMMSALDEVHRSFPAGTSIRCRSSTNNEDLPGFSGAGLYDSYTHHPDEGHFSKSIKQVYASLWNFRAFEERDFYRVDHLTTAMGVLVHPNFSGEKANGVAVTDDVLYQTDGFYYLNTQVGEDLVTNPEEESVPEELLLDWWDAKRFRLLRASNRVKKNGDRILSDKHLGQISRYLAEIHKRFSRLYGKSLDDEDFAMEIEFKITREGMLAIKQARPWVY